MRHRVERESFSTTRLAEFTGSNALTAAIGHGSDRWPLVIVKECTDNGIDKAEEAGRAPVIAIAVTADSISVTDNGPGIDAETVARILNYNASTSSREAYVEPTRGRQGNALQTILAISYVRAVERGDAEPRGVTIIESRRVKHTIAFTKDALRQAPVIEHAQAPSRRFVQSGSRVTVELACSESDPSEREFVEFVQAMSVLNPHLAISLTLDGRKVFSASAADARWPKWQPHNPLHAHWYSSAQFGRLMGAMVAHDQDNGRHTLASAFVASFKGMARTGAQKAVLDAMGARGMSLATLFDRQQHGKLLAVLKAGTKCSRAADLGIIGRDHLANRLESYGAELGTFQYCKITSAADADLPWVIEAAFAYAPDRVDRVLITGANWTPSLGDTFGLGAMLAGGYVESFDPVLVAVHLAYPAAAFTDRGKTKLALPPEIAEAVKTAVHKVTKAWTRQRESEERRASSAADRAHRLARRRAVTQKDAAWDVMEQAYLAASADGTLPANARQIYYAARPLIQAVTGDKPLKDSYFTQILLPDFLNENPNLTAAWNIAYDERGHFEEPHTERRIGLGTLAVAEYIGECKPPTIKPVAIEAAHVETHGPKGRYGALLYIEKEGFAALFGAVQLAERFDIGIMSSKGQSVVAARKLAEEICSRYRIPLLTLHDFDKSGMSIAASFEHDSRRHTYRKAFKVIDLGLRLDDVDREGLRGLAERHTDRGERETRAANLRDNGATASEVEFLLEQRVELNAFTSDRFVAFVERKLEEHGVGKIVPDKVTLAEAYRAVVHSDLARATVEAAIADASKTAVPVPADLRERVDAYLEEHPEAAWDAAVLAIVRQGDGQR